LKTLVSALFTASLFVACAQQPQKPVKVAAKIDSSNIATAMPIPQLGDQELRHYANVSAHFFDSLLGRGFNGSILVAKNNEIVYEHYNGFKKLGRTKDLKDTVDSHTPFHLASVSKTFTAMAVLKLWEQGKLDIHDEVSKYLPGFPFPGTTIKLLLSHRSGLLNYVHFMDRSDWNKRNFLTNYDVLQYIINHPDQVQAAPPGKHFEYSNTNYALLALIIEKVTGQSYADFITNTFFKPLHMQDSYVFKLTDTAMSEKSYKRSGRVFRLEFLDQVYGDKNIFSTTHDLLKWDIALRSGSLFMPATLDSAYSPYSFERPGRRNYGLGWRMLLIPNGKKLIYHNGWWHGNRTVFIRMLDENATIIALSNNDYSKVYASKKLCDLFGDYKQGKESFDDSENEPAGKYGEPPPPRSTRTHHYYHHHKKKKPQPVA
jgi:CubicO group peptidase (beta-lactamase class C family)